MQTTRLALSCLLVAGVCAAQAGPTGVPHQPSRDAYLKLAAEVDDALHHDVLAVWFPRAVDNEHGGFHSHFARDWKKLPSDGKFSVFQGRMTWVAAQVVLHEPARRQEFAPIVRHGVEYLKDVMWDTQDGGFFWGLDDDGKITPQFGDHKELYGMGFCIYGAAAAYQATHDEQALDLAKKGFAWMDQHAHDAEHGGYYEWLTRDGTPVPMRIVNGRVESNGVGPVGFKSMNTHIHLMEAFTQLYEVWPDATLRARLEELLAIVRDKVSVAPGVMNLYFTNAWQAIPDHDSYGHDVETAYLMLETDEVLHGKASEATESMAKMLVDHALAYGWDTKNGGFFHEGTTLGEPENTSKEWWVECEGLNALLLMHERYGKQNPVYFDRFLEQWQFIRNHTLDAQDRGDFNLTTAEGKPLSEDKGSIWKAAYHDSRAFWNVSERLRKLAASQ
ncbi:AGE family epimerase/isomerase [Occallatibacter riparius]|uniref:AGE family epimerase/isomerase n=1 Tax=Occallatibacter riparius TaxID=1002689 RepID=A0A9J7BSV5_9BACT|nr:AGE family epimerase/isomerase [Occallatibacter riparius]UWZ85956.1 AGE family epimerase/isomerase [Occallatibacter riparius]